MPNIDFADELAAATTIEQIGVIVRGAARNIAAADGACFVLRDGDHCFYADEDAIAPLWKGQRFPVEQCISGWVMTHNERARVADIELDPRIPVAAYRPTFVRSLIAVPVDRRRPVGAIGVYWATTGCSGGDVGPMLEPLADATAQAIERIGLADAPWAPNFALRAPVAV